MDRRHSIGFVRFGNEQCFYGPSWRRVDDGVILRGGRLRDAQPTEQYYAGSLSICITRIFFQLEASDL